MQTPIHVTKRLLLLKLTDPFWCRVDGSLATVPQVDRAWNVQAYPSPRCFILLEIDQPITGRMEDAETGNRGTTVTRIVCMCITVWRLRASSLRKSSKGRIRNPKARTFIHFWIYSLRRLFECGSGKRAHKREGDAVSWHAKDGKRI